MSEIARFAADRNCINRAASPPTPAPDSSTGVLDGITGLAGILVTLAGLPALLADNWLGQKVFDRLSEAAFPRSVLVLLLASGVLLII